MKHAVEVDTIQIRLHLQSDVLATNLSVSLLAEDSKRGKEKRMEEGDLMEVPDHSIATIGLASLLHHLYKVVEAAAHEFVLADIRNNHSLHFFTVWFVQAAKVEKSGEIGKGEEKKVLSMQLKGMG
jgi:hypothetical protein